MLPILLTFIIYHVAVAAPHKRGCDDDGLWHAHGERWLRGHHFLVVCHDGVIQVQECVTDVGSIIPRGTENFMENGIEYSCVDTEGSGLQSQDIVQNTFREHDIEGSGELASLCEENNDVVINSFLICCISRRIKGCVDGGGDWVKQGHFLTQNRSLKLCSIQPGGLKGRIENRGCYNGTKDGDVNDPLAHVAKYAVWREGHVDLRCGDAGIHPYRCYVNESKSQSEKKYYVGSAWIDESGDFNICK